ncbi:MAG: hypothetical protein CM15mP85_25050 [Rhodobacterales bacterium]|nr:MAG: hypothetical protein CM15mP85_25050 [Rhodobacterales bacterium]
MAWLLRPKGVYLKTEAQILKMANEVWWQSAVFGPSSRELIWLDDEERGFIFKEWQKKI